MGTIKSFEELEIWKRARGFNNTIHAFTSREKFRIDYTLVNQIKRSAGSIMDNIAEGFERSGRSEFIQFLSISKGSAGETISQLYRALDFGYITGGSQYCYFRRERDYKSNWWLY